MDKYVNYLKKQHQYKKLLTKQLMCLRPDFTITTLRREINFITSIHDGSIKIGELHVNRANYRNFDERDSNVLKRWFAHVWMNSLTRHLKQLDKMVVLTDSALKDWPELNNIVKIPDPLPFPLSAVKSAAGTLPDGRRFLVANPMLGGRGSLVLYLGGRDTDGYEKAVLLAQGPDSELDAQPEWSYPSACVQGDLLHVVYTSGKRASVLCTIPWKTK